MEAGMWLAIAVVNAAGAFVALTYWFSLRSPAQ